MEPSVLGKKYDKIAKWWHDKNVNSLYGVEQVKKAISFTTPKGRALDVGCGAGGRFISILQDQDFAITGLDVSQQMIQLVRENHPDHEFLLQDICTWQTAEKFDFILAWDSIFHLPLETQKPVLSKLAGLLAKDGVLIYTFGDAIGDHTDQWHNDTFYYSSIGINENLQVLMDNGLTIMHLELDQYPLKHVYAIAKKL